MITTPTSPLPKIGNDLIKAYVGYYERKIARDHKQHEQSFTLEEFAHNWACTKIREDKPKERLDTYLTWEGIIGYTTRIYELATGEL